MIPIKKNINQISNHIFQIIHPEKALPVLEASRIPKGLQSFMNEDNLLDLAHNSIITESEETSTTLPSKRRVSSVKARK